MAFCCRYWKSFSFHLFTLILVFSQLISPFFSSSSSYYSQEGGDSFSCWIPNSSHKSCHLYNLPFASWLEKSFIKSLLFIQVMAALTSPFLLLIFHDQKFKTTMSLARISIIMMAVCWSAIASSSIIICLFFWRYLVDRLFYSISSLDDWIHLLKMGKIGFVSLIPIILIFSSLMGFLMNGIYWKCQQKWKIQNKIHAQYIYSLQPYEIESSIRI